MSRQQENINNCIFLNFLHIWINKPHYNDYDHIEPILLLDIKLDPIKVSKQDFHGWTKDWLYAKEYLQNTVNNIFICIFIVVIIIITNILMQTTNFWPKVFKCLVAKRSLTLTVASQQGVRFKPSFWCHGCHVDNLTLHTYSFTHFLTHSYTHTSS